MLEVFFHAMEDLDERRHRPLQPRNAAPLEMHFEHLLSTDPGSSMVADDHGRLVAFGIVMRRGDSNVPFSGLCTLLEQVGFSRRIKGDHHIFWMDGVEEILNLQPRGAKAKAYQVGQVRDVMLRYRLTLGDE